VVTAAPQDQWRLLDVQAHDTRLAQIAHRRRTLPEHAEIERLTTRLGQVGDDLVAARTVASDIERELAKAEADVEHAARGMRRLVDDQHFRRSIGRRASADIRARFDPRSIGQRMRARLAEVDAL